jgi:hypothetical protein
MYVERCSVVNVRSDVISYLQVLPFWHTPPVVGGPHCCGNALSAAACCAAVNVAAVVVAAVTGAATTGAAAVAAVAVAGAT